MKVSWSLRVSTTWPGTGLLGDVDWVVSGCGRRGFVGVNQVGTACVWGLLTQSGSSIPSSSLILDGKQVHAAYWKEAATLLVVCMPAPQ